MPVDDPQMLLWHTIVKRIIRQFLMFGFCVYRVVTLGEPDDTPDIIDSGTKTQPPDNLIPEKKKRKTLPRHKVEIRSGDTVELKFIKRSGTFVAVSNDGVSKKIIARQGNINVGVSGQWRLQLYETPLMTQTDTIKVTSPAARAFGSSISHSQMIANALDRDGINTEPTVFTTVSDRIKAGNGTHTRPWFDNAMANSTSVTARPGLGGSALDFDQLVADRLESITALQQMSNTARKETERLYATAAVGSRSLHEPPQPPKLHSELMITDGMIQTEVSYRRAPEDFLQLLEKFVHDIMFQFSVPPQVLGKNINSERLASSNRLSELAIRRYQVSLRLIRSHLQSCIRHISTTLMNGAELIMKPCISIFNLNQVAFILKDSEAVKHYECAYDMDEGLVDSKKLQEYLTILRQGGKPNVAANSAASAATTESKDEKALDKSKKKAQSPSANTDKTT